MSSTFSSAFIALWCAVICAAPAVAASADSHVCWTDTKSGVIAPLVPRESQADPLSANHRVRPEMRGDDGTVYPAADFVRAPDGLWFDAVTGQTAAIFPEGSSPDPADPGHRVTYKEAANGEDIVVADYRRAPCTTEQAKAAAVRADAPSAARSLDEAVLTEINAARTDPAGYAARFSGSNDPEVLEAVAFLKRQSPLAPLKPQVALLASASRHAVDQGRAGARSHIGTDGSSVRERVVAAGLEPSVVGEEIAFDADSGMGVARQLIVDHGVPDRGHRASLFNASLTYAGVACNPHATYILICVIDVSGPASGQ